MVVVKGARKGGTVIGRLAGPGWAWFRVGWEKRLGGGVHAFPAAQRLYQYGGPGTCQVHWAQACEAIQRSRKGWGGVRLGSNLTPCPCPSPGHVKSKVQAPKAVMLITTDISGGPAQA